jgi:SAM-dependent methyltransferase
MQTIRGFPYYLRDMLKLRKQQKNADVKFDFGKLYSCLWDRFAQSGTASGFYFYQDLLIAKRIFLNDPDLHVDIGSRVESFVAHVATFREILVFDIRELKSNIPNIKFIRADLTGNIDKHFANYCDFLSCLHALEHFGLGRYGNPVKFDGYIIDLNNMYTILKKGGKFYLSVPIGPQRIEFNAHRVFSLKYILSLLEQKYNLDAFSLVNDNDELFENVELTKNEVNRNFGCFYGCGIFEMTKL